MANIELRKKWRAVVDEWAGSEVTAIRWAKEHGVNARQLYSWIAEFKEENVLSTVETRGCNWRRANLLLWPALSRLGSVMRPSL